MFRMIPSTSVQNSKDYYTTADYYTEGQELEGLWRGEGAKQLGLAGVVEKANWDQLCDNNNPETGNKLTVRTKVDRRVGYDFNFHVPKSVSILYSLTEDERLLDAFRSSVHETMQEMESEMKVRVRKDGHNEDRNTGNMVWGEFIHTTSRPVAGVPDPHLHAHCFVFNSSYDPDEKRWKAGQFGDIKRDAPYFEAVFHTKFTERLRNLGLEIERKGLDWESGAAFGGKRSGWDLAGVSRHTIEKFSRRTAQIEAEARKRGIIDPDKKAELGAKTRVAKEERFTTRELKELWNSWLTKDEKATFESLHQRVGTEPVRNIAGAAEIATGLAIDHCFERKSVIPERMLLAESLKRGIGISSRTAVEEAFKRQDLISADRNGRRFVTTRGVLAEERKMLTFARNGRGAQKRFVSGPHIFKRNWLNDDQKQAVTHVLESQDRVILIRGAAGAGKSTTLQEIVEAIEVTGTNVFAFAPSAQASRGTLREIGFESADTVASLLINEKLHEQLKGQTLLIDEAGLLGTMTTSKVFDLAEKLDTRVLFCGDKRQHGSVERGAALRLLETEAGLVPAEIKEIMRQKGDYKEAMKALSEGRTEDGFRALDKLGWIREFPADERDSALASDYINTIQSGKSALVVCPTHTGGARVTAAIRSSLQNRGLLEKEERTFTSFKSLSLTEAERSEAVSYLPGHMVEFNQNAKGYKKGQRVIAGKQELPFQHANRFEAYQAREIQIAKGDLIKITKNGKTVDAKHRFNNGTVYTVRDFDDRGNIVLANGWTISKDFGHFSHGYVMTSHASQGKTVDRVFISQTADSIGASNEQQFYVSASRARESMTLYTDEKEALLGAVSKSDERVSATELINDAVFDLQRDIVRRQELIDGVYKARKSGKERSREEMAYER